MLESVARRRVVWLAGRRPLLGASLAEWLVGLRWIAIAGMLATTLIARKFVPGIALGPVVVVLASIASLNVLWRYLVARSGADLASSPRLLAAQLALDVLFLGAVLSRTGGIENPFSIFLTFQVALAALLCGGARGLAVGALAVVVASALTLAPGVPWQTATVPVHKLERIGRLTAIGGVAAFVGISAFLYRQRLESLRAESARNERFVTLGRLLAGMAHELNTPLATIVVASDELVHASRTTKDPEIEHLSVTVSQEAKRASNVISLLRGQIRDARIMETVDIGRLVRDVVKSEVQAASFSGDVHIDAPAHYGWGIPTALRQILGNIVKNALEAMNERDEGRLDVQVFASGARVAIRVRDNGCGIGAEHLPHLGEPFLTTKASSGGTGLGLYVSSLLAEQMKAVLEIEGGAGGTSVTLSLRAATEDPERISHA